MNRSMIIGAVVGAVVVVAGSALATYTWSDKKTSETAAPVMPEYAEVMGVSPIKETTVTPHQECGTRTVTRRRPVQDQYRVAGTATGAILGGVIGHQFGKGKGKDAATVVGAVAGGYAGNRVQKHMQDNDTYTTTVNSCHTVKEKQEKIVAYDVTYRYNGVTNLVRMDHAPAQRIPVRNGMLMVNESVQTAPAAAMPVANGAIPVNAVQTTAVPVNAVPVAVAR